MDGISSKPMEFQNTLEAYTRMENVMKSTKKPIMNGNKI